MGVQLIAVGTRMPDWVNRGFNEYRKRLPRELMPQLIEIPLAQRSKNQPIAKAIMQEGQAMLAAIPTSSWTIALTIDGNSWSTEKLAQQLTIWQQQSNNLSFLIGGPDGLATCCIQRSTQSWSLSPLTLPHPLVRIVFIEQLYRAWSITQNHPYHR